MQIEHQDDTYYLSGRIDEFADFDSLQAAASPLKLNLGKITSINSVGVRKFLGFVAKWSPRKFEFHACTPAFISNVNVIPQMLGSPADGAQIKSFFIPYSCEACKATENMLVRPGQIKFDEAGDAQVPHLPCASCGEELQLDVEQNEYFMFLRPAAS